MEVLMCAFISSLLDCKCPAFWSSQKKNQNVSILQLFQNSDVRVLTTHGRQAYVMPYIHMCLRIDSKALMDHMKSSGTSLLTIPHV